MSNNGYDPLEPLTIQEVAKILRRHDATIYTYIKEGQLKAIKRYEGQRRPQRFLVIRQDLEKFIYGQYNNYSGRK